MNRVLPMVLVAVLAACPGVGTAAEPPAPQDALKNKDKLVDLTVQNVPLQQALNMLAKGSDLSFIVSRNVTATVSATFKQVTLEQVLTSLITVNGFAYRVRGSVVEVFVPAPGTAVTEVRARVQIFTLQFANAEKLKEKLKAFLSKETGKLESDAAANALIVYDLPDALETISKVIESIDLPEPQVTIGAEIIEASIDVTEKLGIDWQTRVAVTGSSRPITFPFRAKASNNRFVPANDPGDGDDDDDDAGADFTPTRSFPYATREDFTFGTLDATGLKAVLDVLRSDGGTNLIANPEITTLNNREAKINIGNTVPVPIYTTNLETGVSAVTGFEEVETGTILVVTPQVNAGGESVTLAVKPEISEILGFKGQFEERPIVASRKAETTVRLRDGETLVIGGLVSEKTEEVINKIPILGDAPIIGWLFKSKAFEKTKSSLYIFITPRIMTDQGYRDRAKKAVDRLRRSGLKGRVDTGGQDIRKPEIQLFMSDTSFEEEETEN